MEFKVSSSELLKGATVIAKAIPAKTTNPILEKFLLELKGDTLTITASDQELTMRTSIRIDAPDGDFSIAVDAKHLIELLKEIPDQPLRIKSLSDSTIEFGWSTGNSIMSFAPGTDYPEIKSLTGAPNSVTFPAADLVEGISSTIYATADDEMRPVMNGILFDFCEDSTTLVASDAHKLICYTTREVVSGTPTSFILHKKPAAILRGVLDKEIESVTVNFDDKSAMFSFGNTVVICRLIDGKFPRYREVIPKNNSNILKVDRTLFLNAVKRVAVCSNKSTYLLKFALKAGLMEITAQDTGMSVAAYEKVACQYDGDELMIGFKSTFLAEILSNMSCNEVVMKFSDPRKAALILPEADDSQSDKLCGIIMPNTFA